MFIIDVQILWSFGYFSAIIYLSGVTSTMLYLLTAAPESWKSRTWVREANFQFINGADFLPLIYSFLLLLVFFSVTWVTHSSAIWFNHLLLSHFSNKMVFVLTVSFSFTLLPVLNATSLASREATDFLVICLNLLVWTVLLFTTSSLFSLIFLIEILSTLVFLLLVGSSTSNWYFYNNLNLALTGYFSPSLPSQFLQSLIFFFWISLLSSLNLFVFLIVLFSKIPSFDWSLIEVIFLFVSNGGLSQIVNLGFIWIFLLFSIFLKCGLVPFYFWKPTFFKGLPLHSLCLYITFFYFALMLLITYLLLIWLNEIFFYYISLNILILLIGFMFLLSVLSESFYFKTFLAVSSMLNTLFVFLLMTSVNPELLSLVL